MNVLLIVLILIIALGGFGGPAIGFGSYGVAPTGLTGIVIALLIVWLLFGSGRL